MYLSLAFYHLHVWMEIRVYSVLQYQNPALFAFMAISEVHEYFSSKPVSIPLGFYASVCHSLLLRLIFHAAKFCLN